ncbi:hypothetical protein D3C78_1967440 [compost metagenome]
MEYPRFRNARKRYFLLRQQLIRTWVAVEGKRAVSVLRKVHERKRRISRFG